MTGLRPMMMMTAALSAKAMRTTCLNQIVKQTAVLTILAKMTLGLMT